MYYSLVYLFIPKVNKEEVPDHSLMSGILNKSLRYAGTFLITLTVLCALLTATAFIPEKWLRKQMEPSAELLYESELFGTALDNVEGSRIDRYADSILLNIAYHYDPAHPLRSVMESSYYFTPYHEENENLVFAVRDRLPANQQYLRYWHGSILFLRPLLVFLNLQQIYILNAAVLVLLNVLLMGLLVRKRAYAPAAGILIGEVLTAFWFVPLSLEYTWTCLWMLVLLIGAMLHPKKAGWGIFFLLSGMVTAFLDFLTTETLTLLAPLLLVLWLEKRNDPPSPDTSFLRRRLTQLSLRASIAWGIGYVGMWASKWLLASIVLGRNVLPDVTGHIGERIGDTMGMSVFQMLIGAVTRNIGCLFPLGYGTLGTAAAVILLLAAAYLGYVYRKRRFDGQYVLLCTVLGLIPYARYLVLHNHSYLHCFFTYRAQLAGILAAVLILSEIIDWELLLHRGDSVPKSVN